MTAERRAALLAYCRIDEAELTAEESLLLEGMAEYAAGYLEQAGVAEPEAGTPRRAQYELCVNALVLDAWDRRGIACTGTGVQDNPAFRRALNQLKLTEPAALEPQVPQIPDVPDVSKLDTSDG